MTRPSPRSGPIGELTTGRLRAFGWLDPVLSGSQTWRALRGGVWERWPLLVGDAVWFGPRRRGSRGLEAELRSQYGPTLAAAMARPSLACAGALPLEVEDHRPASQHSGEMWVAPRGGAA